jgi:phage N-6-adenine-methyltransferase
MSIAAPQHTRGVTTTDSWITPKWIIDRLGPFDLDPCACDPQPWPTAWKMITESDDGLTAPWAGHVWCNPPYGKALGVWMSRMAQHNDGIALIFARTETKTFFDSVWPHAASVLFLRGRLTFHFPDGRKGKGNSGGPSVLIGYGTLASEKLKQCHDLGRYCILKPTN